MIDRDNCPGIAPRIWIYTNFDCNLQCSYCCAESGPRVERRGLPLHVFRKLIDEAVDAGVRDLFLTGGEPFLLPDIADRVRYAAERVPTTVLTNGSLFFGNRLALLKSLAGLAVRFQVSLDGADAETHDSYRGRGSWRKAIEGISTLQRLGHTVVIASTETPINAPHIDALREFVSSIGIPADRHFVRPLARRGFSAEGLDVTAADLDPEISVSIDGVYWHPLACADDMLITRRLFPFRDAVEQVHAQYHAVLANGSLPQPFR